MTDDLPQRTQASSDDQANKQDQPAVTGGLPAGKERVELKRGEQEKTPMTEYTRKVDLEPEVEGWLEKLEKEDTRLVQPVLDDTGQVILEDSKEEKTKFKVVLPLTKDEVEKGLHHKVADSVRWLSEWCVRMIKMFAGKVAYRKK